MPDPETRQPVDHVRPVIHETLTSKSMFFSQNDVQSQMHLLQPDALQFDYTKIMMGFLLHNPEPRSIAMIGLGGGSLAKFCYRYLPHTAITVVEINPHVIRHRADFAVPPDDARFKVLLADGADYVQETEQRFDVLLADGFDIGGLPERLSSSEFYNACFHVLNPGGMFVANLHGCNQLFEVFVDRIRTSFHGELLTVQDPGASNRLAFAVRGAPQALQSLAGIRCPHQFDPEAWKELVPSLARVYLAARERVRQEKTHSGRHRAAPSP